MKCPFCGGSMLHGSVMSEHGYLFWTKDTNRLLLPNISDEALVLDAALVRMPSIAADRCEACKKIIIDYSEE